MASILRERAGSVKPAGRVQKEGYFLIGAGELKPIAHDRIMAPTVTHLVAPAVTAGNPNAAPCVYRRNASARAHPKVRALAAATRRECQMPPVNVPVLAVFSSGYPLSWEVCVPLISAPQLGQKTSLVDLATQSFPGMVFWVLVLLAVFSLASWYVIGYKYFHLRRAKSGSDAFLEAFWRSRRLDEVYTTAKEHPESPTAQVFAAGYVELSKLQSGAADGEGVMRDRLGDLGSVERAMVRAQMEETTRLEAKVAFLATTGSSAPFVGLFGTVWGIMTSFRDITASGAASVSVVAPGIAEALIATAMGLMAAIPAVIAYNLFVQRIKVLSAEMETFSNDFLNIVKRHVLK